jgi:phage gp29-like protein
VNTVGAANNNGESFNLLEISIVRRIDKLVLGQTLSTGTDGGSGNRALGQVHDNVRMDKVKSDIAMVKKTLQKIVAALCELNGIEKVPEVVMAHEKGLEKDRSARDETLTKMGVTFTKGYFIDNYGFREDEINIKEVGDGSTGTEGNNAPDPAPKPELDKDGNPIPPDKALKQSKMFIKRSAKSRFTRHQQVIEDVADDLLSTAPQPLDPALVRSAVLSASSPEDLEQRLFALIGERVTQSQFAATLEASLYAADVIGYVHSTGADA